MKKQWARRSVRGHFRRVSKAVGIGDTHPPPPTLVEPRGEGEPLCASGVPDQHSRGRARAWDRLGFQPLLPTRTLPFGKTQNIKLPLLTVLKYTV